MHRERGVVVPVIAGCFLIMALIMAAAAAAGEHRLTFLPLVVQVEPPTPTPVPEQMVEFRGVWVTRFDWMNSTRPASPTTVVQMVDNAADAGFNVLLFQVRGTADAYYASTVEPWASRLTGQLGAPPVPYWDPLATMIARAHERGLQVHAYINVYPVWLTGSPPPVNTQPQHLYHLLAAYHGTTFDGRNKGLQWDTAYKVAGASYWRASPASSYVDQHLMQVTRDLVSRYDIDGLHLDHIRYNWRNTSCDPVSEASYGATCFSDGGYSDWQRAQVNGTVRKFYTQLFASPDLQPGPNFWLSAAVWPIYSTGYHDYYQDPKAWLAEGTIDAVMPMLYGSFDTGPDAWAALAAGFQADNHGRYVIAGIGSPNVARAGGAPYNYDDIVARIAATRALGLPGHAIFSYGGLADAGYLDGLAAGPYATPAVLPPITWHP